MDERRERAAQPGRGGDEGLSGNQGLRRRRQLRTFERNSAMNLAREHQLLLTRRQLFGRATTGIGTAALASLLNPAMFSTPIVSAGESGPGAPGSSGLLATHGALRALHFAPKAKRVIYLV